MANTKDFIVKNGLTVGNNITVSGTVDGRDIATDGSKLDGIESGATADQSASEILTLIKTVDGSGSGLDADTLDGLNSTSLSSNNYVQTQLGTKLNSSSYTASDVLTKIKTVDGSGSGLDADTLDGLQGSSYSSNNYITDHYTSNNYIQTYVAAQVASVVDSAPAALDTLNELAAALGDDANFSTTVSNQIGIRSTNTYVNSTFSSNNYLQGQLSTKLSSSSYTASDVLTKIKTVDGSGSGLDADTLDGIQGSGFLQTSGGTLTGALSGTSLSLSSSASGTKFTGTAQSTTAPTTDDAKFDGFGVQGNRTTNPIYIHNEGAGGVRISSNATLGTQNGILVKDTVTDISGNLTISGTVDGRDIATDGSKLDGIESGATADQTASEILTAIKTVDGSGSGLDADTLDGQHGSYYAQYDHFRSLGTTAFTGTNTTAGMMSEIEGDGGFDSYTSAFKTSWSYAGNFDLSDGGSFGPTETAGMSFLTWTDNSSDTTRGNITVLAIAPTTGGSAGGVYVYNDQGSSYNPGWREIWTSSTDGSGSGLDADLLDGIHASGLVSNNYFQDNSGGGATGGGSDAVFHNNDQTVTTNYSIPSGQNSMSAGPITINSGVTVTVPSGSEWTIV